MITACTYRCSALERCGIREFLTCGCWLESCAIHISLGHARPHLLQRESLDLTDALARQIVHVADLLERALFAVVEAVAIAQDLSLERGELAHQLGQALFLPVLNHALFHARLILVAEQVDERAVT